MKFYTKFKKAKIPFLAFLFIVSCSKDDPDAVNEQEFISNVLMTIESVDGTSQTVDWD